LVYFYLPGKHSSAAESLLQRDPDWATPSLWRSEFRNVLAGQMRRGDITYERACVLQAEAEALVAGAEFDVDSRQVLKLVRDSDCTAYDCEFIALAMQLETTLCTMDAKLLRAFPQHTVALAPS
jgi:predicted nucleic acid-binding protein